MLSIRTAFILPIGLMLLLSGACAFAPSAAPGNLPTPAGEGASTDASTSSTTPAPVDTGTPELDPSAEMTVPPTEGQASGTPVRQSYSAPPPMTIDVEKTYTATLFTSKGDLVLNLFTLEAPMTVNNFVFLARAGFYNGVNFHRIMKDFMVQAGDPNGDGTGGPGYQFADEPVTRAYTRGILAMANRGPNTNGSQFFIVHAEDAGLAPGYTIFGEVTSGLETLDAIAATPVGASPRGELSVPLEAIYIERIEIEESP
jgi:peptidylprolyl isomerase